MSAAALDTRRYVEIPEGVTYAVTPAGVGVRALAAALDLALRGAAFAAVSGIVNFVLGTGEVLITFFAIDWLYGFGFEAWKGATPGKMVLGLRVTFRDGRPIGWRASAIRNLLRVADFLPFAYLFGLISVLVTHSFQRIGDLAADTIVVHARKAHVGLDELGEAPPEPAPLPLSPLERDAIVRFAQLAPRWSEARRAEVADRLRALIPRASSEERARRIYGIARWLIGDRR